MTPRAGAVKAGRRSVSDANAGPDRPRLDGAEHGVMLGRVGTAAAATLAAATLAAAATAAPAAS